MTVTLLLLALLPHGCRPPDASQATPASGAGVPDPRGLCARIDAVLAHAREARRLDASIHGAWQVVHGVLALGPDFPLRHDGREEPALGYLLGGGNLVGWQLRPGSHGVLTVVEEGSTTGQGHPDQWLGYLSQCGTRGIPPDTKLIAGGREFTVNDLLTQAQADVRPGREATWTLMALAAYLPSDAVWTASDGQRWTTERVVRMEAESDIFSAACGGAHRLYGLACALASRASVSTGRGRPDDGWSIAQDVLEDCIDRARRFQQPDGSFSSHSFERPGSSADAVVRLGTTGHVFEVLARALDDRRLVEPWVTRAAARLLTLLEQTADVDVECGALYHALHGLLIYKQRLCAASP